MSPSESIAALGKGIPRRDAQDKVSGKAVYVADIHRPNMLYGGVVRSPYAHALIKGIDISAALEHPGVVAAFTAADIPGKNITGQRVVKDQPVLVSDRARFAGEAVAVVAAESEEAARRGAELVRVQYEPLPVVDDPAAALHPDAPQLHEKGNLCSQCRILKGDWAAAERAADIVLTRTYRMPWEDHACIEPDGAVAEPDGDGVMIWVCSKGVHVDRNETARVLGLPPEKVRVVATVVGGSFGSKPDLASVCLAALIAFKTRRPAKIVLTREEYFAVKTKRHPYTITYTHAVRRDGKILGVRVEAIADAGAYSSFTPSVISRGLIHATGPYVVPNVEMEVRAAFTNHPVTGAFRGYGEPQFTFAVERQMDLLAQELHLDPWEIRRRNAMSSGDQTSTGQTLSAVHVKEMLDRAREQAEALDIQDRAAGRLTEDPRYRRAWGIVPAFYGLGRTGLSDKGQVTIRLEDNGHFRLFVGCPDTGQGSDMAMAQIAAEELGVALDLVQVTSADTLLTLDTGTTTATRVTYIVGNAVKRAATDLRTRLLSVAQEKEGPGVSILASDAAWLAALAAYCHDCGAEVESVGKFATDTTELDGEGQGSPYGTYSFGVQATRARVDTWTGKVDVEQVVACYDVGHVINPLLLAGQIDGGTVMAQGYGLTEEMLLDQGVIVNPNFARYLLPTAADVPPITQVILESKDPAGPFGAKGVGELTAVPGAPSLANAVSAALGVDLRELPATPERLYALLAEQAAASA